MTAYATSAGPIRLGRELGRGGEGAVFELPDRPGEVAKIYHRDVAPQKARKIEIMASMQSDALRAFTTWPLALVRDAAGAPRGVLLPRLPAGYLEIHHLYGPKSRRTHFPAADWRFLVRAAANTARAFATIHDAGVVVGDVNEGGIRVSRQATVVLIDCDSFQVVRGAERFPCEVGVPLFTPPELQGRPFAGVIRTPDHDNFGLAVLVFQLLFLGRHPYAGRFLGAGEMPIERAISERRFPYGTSRALVQMEPPPFTPDLDGLPAPIPGLLERAFGRAEPGARPAAAEWVAALDALEKQVEQCAAQPTHVYPVSAGACPWCRIEAATGVPLFQAGAPPGAGLDAAALWAQVLGVAPPDLERRIAYPTLAGLAPSAAVEDALHLRRRKRWLYLAVGLAAVAMYLVAPGWGALWAFAGSLAPVLIYGVGIPLPPLALVAAEGAWETAVADWEAARKDGAFGEKRRELERAFAELGRLPHQRRERLAALATGDVEQQRQRWLAAHPIDAGRISGFGESLKATLHAYGIHAASDITHANVSRLPGFGPGRVNALYAWRRSVEQAFAPPPPLDVDPRDVERVDRELAARRTALEGALSAGASELLRLRARQEAALDTLRRRADALAAELAQARRDQASLRLGRVDEVLPLAALAAVWLGFIWTDMFPAASPEPHEVAAPTRITVQRDCDVEVREDGSPRRVRARARAGERFEMVRVADGVVEVLRGDGAQVWIPPECLL